MCDEQIMVDEVMCSFPPVLSYDGGPAVRRNRRCRSANYMLLFLEHIQARQTFQ